MGQEHRGANAQPGVFGESGPQGAFLSHGSHGGGGGAPTPIHAEILALIERARKAQIERDAEWQAKGFVPAHMRSVTADEPLAPPGRPERSYELPDDGTFADVTWLRFTLAASPPLSRTNWAALARERYTRGEWRRAVAALVATSPGLVRDPAAQLRQCLKTRRMEPLPDPRTLVGYAPFDTWGTAALKFCGLPH